MTPLLLRNARLTGRAGLWDVLLAGGRVAAITPVGPTSGPGARTLAAPPRQGLEIGDITAAGVEPVDVDGRVVVPGLWDAHTHLTQWAIGRRRLDVSAARSPEHAARLVRAALGEAGRGPLVGFGFRWATWASAPTAAVLDAVAGDVPVVLVAGDLHAAWASTAGLRFLGLTHPTGLLREEEWMRVSDVLVTLPDAVTDELVRDAARAAAARGVVGVVDFEMADNLTAWRRRGAAGWDGLRVRAGVWEEHLDAVVAEGLRSGDPLTPGGLVTQGPLKVITDGSLNTRTAYCDDAYPGAVGPEAHGHLAVGPERLVPLLVRAREAGLRAAVHAIGDHANALALDAFAASGARGSIEHAQLLRPDDVERFAALGVVASVQPEHAMDDRDAVAELWPGREERCFPLADLLTAGVRLRFGSDAPVAPLDPWVAIAAAVTRERDGRAPWHPEQRIGVGAALTASVDGAPLGLAPGMAADLAVLDEDPFDPRTDLRTLPVAATLLAGRTVHGTLAG